MADARIFCELRREGRPFVARRVPRGADRNHAAADVATVDCRSRLLLFGRDGRPYRMLGWIYVILFLVFLIQNARFYFLAPAYPMLFAAGATAAERFVRRRSWSWIKPAYVIVLAVSGLVVAPLTVVPALPAETLAGIAGAAGGNAGVQIETRKVAQLPQNFADRFGWKQMTATVGGVYHGLPADQRAEACILTGNYGAAGAIDFFGPPQGLPNAISGHNS